MKLNSTSKILITGASGMVGQSLVKLLKHLKYKNLLTPSSKELNLLDNESINSYFKKNNIEYVFHLAGHIGGIKASISRPVEFLYENNQIAMNTIYAAHNYKVKKLLFLGSSCIYPRECPQPMREEYLLAGQLSPVVSRFKV